MIHTDGTPTIANAAPQPAEILERLREVEEANGHRLERGYPRLQVKRDLEADLLLQRREAHLKDAVAHALETFEAEPAKQTGREKKIRQVLEAALLSYRA